MQIVAMILTIILVAVTATLQLLAGAAAFCLAAFAAILLGIYTLIAKLFSKE